VLFFEVQIYGLLSKEKGFKGLIFSNFSTKIHSY